MASFDKSYTVDTTEVSGFEVSNPRAQIRQHARREHLGEAGAFIGGVATLYEKHKANKDPENAHKHRIEEAIAGAVATGSAAYAWHERHDKKDAEKQAKYHM